MSNYGPPPPGSPQDPYGQQPQNPYGQSQNPYGQPQDPYGQPFPGSPGFGGPGSGDKGFWASLFDFSFNHFVTPKIVKFVYILVTILIILGWLIYTIVGFAAISPGAGIGILIGGGIVALVYLCFARMSLEFFVAVTRMSEDIHERLPKG